MRDVSEEKPVSKEQRYQHQHVGRRCKAAARQRRKKVARKNSSIGGKYLMAAYTRHEKRQRIFSWQPASAISGGAGISMLANIARKKT